jgi:hypothetical protein
MEGAGLIAAAAEEGEEMESAGLTTAAKKDEREEEDELEARALLQCWTVWGHRYWEDWRDPPNAMITNERAVLKPVPSPMRLEGRRDKKEKEDDVIDVCSTCHTSLV